jgi:hypothetical protein
MPLSHPSTRVARDLDWIFSVQRMERVWKRDIRTGLRRQPLADLHDFLDVHRNLVPYLRALRNEVLTGQYKPQPPEISLLEKRDGIPRRLSLPSPGDAILLQAIVEVLEGAIAESQPHPNAYYAQSHSLPSVEDVDGTFAYPWWVLWPQFQQRIWQFVSTYDYVVVTDIANYFDCIPLRALRNRIAATGAFNETVLDFLFFLLDAFTWRPFYMPQSGVGLPQINFDAPRLLAHAYLFPVDKELDQRTHGDFVRWMDDINCGVSDVKSARRLLRELEIVLNSLGIRLNTNKTRILKAQEAVTHFWIQENRTLTILSNLAKVSIARSGSWIRHRAYARRRFRAFLRKPRTGQWEKVYKRYLTLFSTFGDTTPQNEVPGLLRDVPALRGSVCRYYSILGPSKLRLAHIAEFVNSGSILDDASLFELVRCLVAWRGQTRGARRDSIVALSDTISRIGSESVGHGSRTVAGVAGSVWLLSKYGTSVELLDFIRSSREVWTRSSWAARQVAAALPLVAEGPRLEIRNEIVQTGLTEALRVLANIDQFRMVARLDPQLRAYLLHPPTGNRPYPLEKAIVARVVLRARLTTPERRALRSRLTGLIQDPCYLSIIKRRV